RLRGVLDSNHLKAALQKIVQRHEILRCRFPTTEGAPVQVVDAELQLEFPLINLAELPEANRESEAQKKLKETAQQPFNLAQGPLIRSLLVRLSAEEHLLLVVMHHIICDGWSLAVLFRELELTCSALAQNREPQLPELPLQYGDYSWWQRQTVAGNH